MLTSSKLYKELRNITNHTNAQWKMNAVRQKFRKKNGKFYATARMNAKDVWNRSDAQIQILWHSPAANRNCLLVLLQMKMDQNVDSEPPQNCPFVYFKNFRLFYSKKKLLGFTYFRLYQPKKRRICSTNLIPQLWQQKLPTCDGIVDSLH